jgi:hypothetical protein
MPHLPRGVALRHASKGPRMALTDSGASVYIPGTGFIYLAPAETVIPASLTAPAAPWENMGHTSRDDGLTITRDGGDSEVLGTWQNPSLRERRDPVTFAITMVAHQVDNTVLGLYFGGGDTTVADHFGVNSTTGTTEQGDVRAHRRRRQPGRPLPAEGLDRLGRRHGDRPGGLPVLPAARHGAAGRARTSWTSSRTTSAPSPLELQPGIRQDPECLAGSICTGSYIEGS